jgi:hypothetical protein
MKHLILFFLLSFLILQSCKKDKRINTSNDPVFLRDKSVTEVKAAMVGNWQIHYASGYSLQGRYKTLTPNSYLRVSNNDSVYLIFNNILYAAGKATYQKKVTEFGFSAVIIDFPTFNGPNSNWIYDYKIKDSLRVNGNCPSCEGYMMIKLP